MNSKAYIDHDTNPLHPKYVLYACENVENCERPQKEI